MLFNIKLCTVFLNNFLYFCGTNQWRKDLAQISNSYPNRSANMASEHRATITGLLYFIRVQLYTADHLPQHLHCLQSRIEQVLPARKSQNNKPTTQTG